MMLSILFIGVLFCQLTHLSAQGESVDAFVGTWKLRPNPKAELVAGARAETTPLEILRDSVGLALNDDHGRARRLEIALRTGGQVAGANVLELVDRRFETVRLPVGTVEVLHVETLRMQSDGTLLRVIESSDGRQTVRHTQVFRREQQ